MRADVKLGVAISAVLVSVVGGYFTFRGKEAPSVPAASSDKTPVDAGDSKDGRAASPATAPNGKRIPAKTTPSADGKPAPGGPADPNHPSRRRTVSPVMPSTGQPVPAGSGAPNAAPSVGPATRPASGSPSGVVPATPTTIPPRTAAPPAAAPASSGAAVPTGGDADRTPGSSREPARPAEGTTGNPSPTGNSGTATPSDRPATDRLPADAAPVPNPAATAPATTTAPNTSGTGPAAPADGPSAPNARTGSSGMLGTPLSATAPSNDTVGRPADSRASSPRSDRPASGDRPAVATDTHRVQAGDTLASLARSYYGSERFAKFLRESNPQLGSSDALTPGSLVRIPATPKDVAAGAASEPAPGDKLASPSTIPPREPGSGSKTAARTYQVRTGDSFYSIARTVLGDAKRWKELYELNRKVVRDDPKSLRPGQVLTLPQR